MKEPETLPNNFSKIQEEQIDQAAKTIIEELLRVCERQDIDKIGLIKEFRHGLTDEYIESVSWKNEETKDLDLERMARIGRKRKQLNQGKGLDKDQEDWPRKIVDHTLEG